MQLSRPGLAAELLLMLLCFAGLGGTAALVIEAERRHGDEVRAKNQPAPVIVVSRPKPAPTPALAPAPRPTPPTPAPLPVPEDPTPRAIAQIDKSTAEQKREAERLAKEIREKESLLKTAEAQAEKWRGSLVDRQALLFNLNAKAERLEMEAARASIEVDVLEQKREELKAELKQSEGRSSYAILPNKGPNGTWRRPIVIECADGQVAIMPKGPTFGLAELLEIPGFGNSSFRSAVAREAVRIQRGATPDGRIVVPYFFFLIRPDGIKSYYAARRQLEPLGIAFGYELADEDWEIDYPDLDDPDTWTGQAPAAETSAPASSGGTTEGFGGSKGDGTGSGSDNPFVWPSGPPGAGGPGRVAGGPDPLLDGSGGPLGEERPGGASGLPRGPGGGLAGSEGGRHGGAAPGSGDLAGQRPDGPVGQASEWPPGFGEEVSPKTAFEKTWAETLARRGLPSQPGGGRGASGEGTGGEDPQTPTGRPGDGGSRSKPGSGSGGGESEEGSSPGEEGTSGGSGGIDLGSGRVEGMELVIACESRGVVIHPGDYRVTSKGLSGKEPLLSSQLRALYKAQKERSPGKVLVPRIRYVVEPGGHATFAKARTQVALDGIDWPTTVQISGGDVIRGLSREDW